MTRNCNHCGVEYEAKTVRSRYCRAVCRTLAHRAEHPRTAPARTSGRKRTERRRCIQCESPLELRTKGDHCHECRKRWGAAPCTTCGVVMKLTGNSGLGPHRHRACRSVAVSLTCPGCGGPKSAYSIKCFACAMTARRFRPETDPRSTRRAREYSAPGLSMHYRKKLLARWVRQGRTCSYCDAPATTVDHVVPLVRGGTNFEGNLTPACRSCNSRKAFRLVVEMRAKGVRRDGQDLRAVQQGVRGRFEPRDVLRLDMQGAPL